MVSVVVFPPPLTPGHVAALLTLKVNWFVTLTVKQWKIWWTMICDCFLRPIGKHPTSSSYITGAPLTSANIILVVVLSINPIRRRLDTGSRGVMFYVDSSNVLRTNHLRSPQNMSVFVWSVWSCYKSVNFPFSVGAIVARRAGPSENSERGASCREEKREKKAVLSVIC